MKPIVVWLIVMGVFALLLLGWAVAWWHDRKDAVEHNQRMRELRRIREDAAARERERERQRLRRDIHW